ncbi:septum formation initiator family protein [Candidatus Uhrbacteria bacterium]|nr:septum formation initiator family protein [Candidatus Uhrbacteria bacterium]
MRRPSTPWSLLRSRLVLLVLIIACAYAAQAIIREAQRRSAVRREIRTMEESIAKLERQRTRLSDLLKRTDEPEFIEREARLRLGLQRPGESVYIVRPTTTDTAPIPGIPPPEKPSNPKKWWQRFFR